MELCYNDMWLELIGWGLFDSYRYKYKFLFYFYKIINKYKQKSFLILTKIDEIAIFEIYSE